VSKEAPQPPAVSGSQVLSAGFASAGAAIITSKFGVAGTLIGAALTTMIITGGSAILKAYLESVGGTMLEVPQKIKERRARRKAERYERASTLPGRPDLRNNFAGRMRAALGWFSHLPPLARRPIIVKGLLAALLAFVIGISSIYAVEKVINNNLSCGFWGNCPEGATPGIHLTEGSGAGTSPTIGLNRTSANGDVPNGGVLERGGRVPADQDTPVYGGGRQNPDAAVPAEPDVEPVDPVEPQTPADSTVEPGTPGEQVPTDETKVPGVNAAPSSEEAIPAE
jgi:hypothetical protein